MAVLRYNLPSPLHTVEIGEVDFRKIWNDNFTILNKFRIEVGSSRPSTSVDDPCCYYHTTDKTFAIGSGLADNNIYNPNIYDWTFIATRKVKKIAPSAGTGTYTETITADVAILVCNTTLRAVQVALPSPGRCVGRIIPVIRQDPTNANPLVVVLAEGSLYTMNVVGATFVEFGSDGESWYKIEKG